MVKRILINPGNAFREQIGQDLYYQDFINFIKEFGNGHITKRSMEYFSSPTKIGIASLWITSILKHDRIIGISASKIEDGVDYSITVVSPIAGGIGLGAHLLKDKLRVLPDTFTTTVAEDNDVSLNMCLKAGLVKVGTEVRTRKDGEFNVFVFAKQKQQEEKKEIYSNPPTVWESIKSFFSPVSIS